jgi:hypothetical protein
MDLTDSFTWEDLPTRNADTGHLAAAGWIPLTMKYSRIVAITTVCFHTVQSTIRIVTNHETQISAWYPFDWTVSPFYELVNIKQVTNCKTEFSSVFIEFLIKEIYLIDRALHFPLFISVPLHYFSDMLIDYKSLALSTPKRKRKIFSITPSWYIESEIHSKTERENENILDIRCLAGTK